MKRIQFIAIGLILVLMSSCSGMNDRLEKMIPADATGVLVIDLPSVLSKASMVADDKVLLPKALEAIVDQNDKQAFCSLLNDMPVMGLDLDSKIYAFTTEKTFSVVGLIPICDEAAARKVMSQRLDAEFEMVEGLSNVFEGEFFCAVDDHVLFVGRMGALVDRKQAALAALSILKAASKSIMEDDDVKQCIHENAELNAYLTPASANALHQMEPEGSADGSAVSTLLGLIAQTDVKAVTCHLNINDDNALLKTQVIADEKSDYVALMNAVMSKPGTEFLDAIPGSMEHIFSFSVDGAKLSSLPLMAQLAEMFKKVPGSSAVDLKSLVSCVSGPVAVAGASDPHLPGVWNTVLAVQCNDPDSLISPITEYASSIGQLPEKYDDEFIYQYDNKMVKLGSVGKVVYLKMLDYDMPEESAAKNADLKNLFASSPMAISSHYSIGASHASFVYSIKDVLNGEGKFTCDDKQMNVAEALLMTLCSIRPSVSFAEDDETTSLVPLFN